MTSHQKCDIFQHQNWLLSRPLCFTLKLTHFKTLCSDVWRNIRNWLLSRPLCFYIRIDSFQDPVQWLIWQNVTNWLLSRPLCFASNLDSFQDPTQFAFLDTNWLISRPCAVNYPKHHPIDSFQDPHIGLLQCFNLHGRLPAKSPWETTFIHNSSKHPTQWNLDFFMKQRRKTHHMQVINTFQAPRCNTFYIRHRNIHQNRFLSRPQKLHINHSQQYLSKDTISSTLTQDKDTVTVHIANLYILISDFKLLKSTLRPLRTHSRLPKSNRSHKDKLYHLVQYKYQSQC